MASESLSENPALRSGGLTAIISDRLPAFSFGYVGAKEKARKKKNAEKRISRSAEREKGSAPFTARAFEKARPKLA
jgi:hypothetical protein